MQWTNGEDTEDFGISCYRPTGAKKNLRPKTLDKQKQQQHETENKTKGKTKAIQVAANLPKTENVRVENGKETKAAEENKSAEKITEERKVWRKPLQNQNRKSKERHKTRKPDVKW